MKRLLTLSLLLFSVDVFADDEYCYVAGNRYEVEAEVQKLCKKDEVIFASVSETADKGTFIVNQLVFLYCDFEQEIIINSDRANTFLLCVMNDNEKRSDKR